MPFSPADTAHMSQALALAKQALFITSPNPRVGCVIVGADGTVLGQGHTQMAGQAHAEVMALRDAQAQGRSTQGATAYVSLEPCSHYGRTGPCCDALVAAGITKVVASVQDPNSQVAGQGLARLQAAGVNVSVGLLAAESEELNIGFFKRMRQGTPWLRMKSAQSLDGQTALNSGQSQWITGEAARLDGHRFRAQACAVLTGIGTVLEDNPTLNVRGIDTPRQPGLLLVDSRLQTPLDARLWEVQRQIVIFHAERHPAREAALKAQGAQLVCLPGEGEKVDLKQMLRHLGQLPCNEVHIEAGHKLNGSLLQAGLVDELLVYVAPMLLGPGQAMAALPERHDLPTAGAWVFTDHMALGSDLRVRLRAVR